MKKKRGSTHDKMFEAAHFGKKAKPKKRPSKAAMRTGSVRASLPAPKPKPKKVRPNMIGRDVKTGKFVSLEETVKRPKGTVVEKFTPKAKKKK